MTRKADARHAADFLDNRIAETESKIGRIAGQPWDIEDLPSKDEFRFAVAELDVLTYLRNLVQREIDGIGQIASKPNPEARFEFDCDGQHISIAKASNGQPWWNPQ